MSGTPDPNKDLPSVLRSWFATIQLAWRIWPAGSIARTAISLVSWMARGLGVGLSLKHVIDESTTGSVNLFWIAILAVSIIEPLIMQPIWNHVQSISMTMNRQQTTAELMDAALRPAGIEHLESGQYADHLEILRAQASQVSLLLDWLATAAAAVISVGISMLVLARVHPLLVMPVLLAAGVGTLQVRARGRALKIYEGAVPGQRLASRLVEIGTTPVAAKDLRMLDLRDWLLVRHKKITDEVTHRMIAGERKPMIAASASGVLQAILLASGIGLLAALAADGTAGAGDVALGVVLLQSALSQAGGMGQMGADLARNTFTARRYLWLRDYQPPVISPESPRSVPERLTKGIHLEIVSFVYPGTDRAVLQDINLSLPVGTTIALVGDNGAGKSTIIKLLLRLYDPSNGKITVDGTDLRLFDLESWRQATSGAFQDFMRFQFMAGESVGSGDLEQIDNLERVRAASRAGGAASFLEQLPEGYGTQLGRQFPGGAELSEGQWQKVAISRSVMRRGHLLLLLDEPTAALDARSENDLFERFAAEASSARSRGAITVLVSHRFSTVRMADLIVVLEGGRVIETGTHNELMSKVGRYAALYEMQASRYRQNS